MAYASLIDCLIAENTSLYEMELRMIIADWQYLKPKNPKAWKMAGPEQKNIKRRKNKTQINMNGNRIMKF